MDRFKWSVCKHDTPGNVAILEFMDADSSNIFAGIDYKRMRHFWALAISRRPAAPTSVFEPCLDAFTKLRAPKACATIEAAIIGTPFVIVYKTSAFNWNVLRPLISVDHYGLVNLVAGKRIVKELVQQDLTVAKLSKELFHLLDPAVGKRITEELKRVRQSLGEGGASKRAAEAVLRLISD